MVTRSFRSLTSLNALLALGYCALLVGAMRLVLRPSSDGPAMPWKKGLEALSAPRASGGATLLFVFNPRDCPEALRLGRLWGELYRTREMNVLGVVVDAPREPEALDRVLEEANLAFPVIAEPGSELRAGVAALGYRTTPVSILMDGRLRPRLIVPGIQDSLAQLEAFELVKRETHRMTRLAEHERL